MLKNVKFGFIGSGAMATAMIAGLTKQELITPENVTASDPYPGQLQKLAERYHVNTTHHNLEAVKGKDVVSCVSTGLEHRNLTGVPALAVKTGVSGSSPPVMELERTLVKSSRRSSGEPSWVDE